MTPGQLVRAVSIALDVPEETVVQHDRNLAVAGLRTKGGRGRSAPEVNPLDAARLFVATLASIRTKDSVATIEEFERAKLGQSRLMPEVTFVDAGGMKVPRFDKLQETAKFRDVAITRLPTTHNFIEGLAAVIADASLPIDDFQLFLTRFSNLGVRCSAPVAYATLGSFATYSVPTDIAPKPTPKSEERKYYTSGIQQDRRVAGTAIMLLGAAFRDNGPRYTNAYEAYLAGYGTENDKPNKAAEPVRRAGDR